MAMFVPKTVIDETENSLKIIMFYIYKNNCGIL